jgi:hypothetical protein
VRWHRGPMVIDTGNLAERVQVHLSKIPVLAPGN